MKSLEAILSLIHENRTFLEDQFFVSKIGVFGSYSKNYSSESSDIDILVALSQKVDFFLFLKLEQFLSDLLSIRVDLVTFNALRTEIKDDILREVVYAYL